MEDMGAFDKPDYTPMPNTKGKDNERQKDRLANIMAFGEDIDPKKKKQMARPKGPVNDEPDIDRFDELQLEIDERRNFLSEMEKHGQGAKFRPLIETEISQKIREMELIDKKRTAELERLIEANRKQQSSS